LATAPASALDPSRSLEQFGHTAFGADAGTPGSVYALAQTRDGYLWIGTARGLYRFDGKTFTQIPPFEGKPARSDGVTALLVAANGDLWVGHYWGGVSVLRGGSLEDANPAPADGSVCGIVQSKDGAIWVALDGRLRTQLRRYFHGRWDIINAGERGLPKANLTNLLATRDGSVWASFINSVARLKPGTRTFETVDDVVNQAAALTEDADGRVWVLDESGTRPLAGRPGRRALSPSKDTRVSDIAALITDRQGTIWEANGPSGLARISNPRAFAPGASVKVTDQLKPKEGGILSGYPNALLEDREGDIWIGTDQGLDRLRNVSVADDSHAPAPAGLQDDHALLLPATNGDFYTLTSADYGKLDPENPIRVRFNRKGIWTDISKLAGHPTAACVGRDASLWLADKSGLHNIKNGAIARVIPWPLPAIGNVDGCKQAASGQIWISATTIGMFRFDGRAWAQFDPEHRYGSSNPYSWAVDGRGRLLASFGTRDFVRSDGPHIETLLTEAQIEIRLIDAIYSIGDRIIVGGEKGLMVGDAGHFWTLSAARFPYLAHVNGISRTSSGDLWIGSAVGVVRVAEKDLNRALADPNADMKARVFDYHDGLNPEEMANTNIVEGRDGRLWITIVDGMVSDWIDPHHLRHNDLARPVHIQSLFVNGHPRVVRDRTSLPAGVNRLQIDYTAPSLAAPERVMFRYRLDGVDRDWVDAERVRQAVYTNLEPGRYRFKVIAANEDGVWNTEGASTELNIPPTFLQSQTFKALCLIFAAAALWGAYQLRVRQISNQLRLRLEERTAERERIARELHDTLLQGVQGLIFRFQAAAARVSHDPAARQSLEQALDRADELVAEARDRVVQLRRTKIEGSLPQILERSAARIFAGSLVETRLTVEGASRDLSALVEEELVSIANEFMANTLQHSGARRLDIAVNYGRKSLSLQLSDDGKGIDLETLDRKGREGHFGLPGMSERARKIGASFDISSQPGAGVMMSMNVPAVSAYLRAHRRFFRNSTVSS